MDKKQKLDTFFASLEGLDADTMTTLVEKHLSDDEIEIIIRHLEDFYGIEEEEELGMLTQIIVTGFLAGLSINQSV